MALARRAGAALAGLQHNDDPTPIRHLYDLHAIREHYDVAEVGPKMGSMMEAKEIYFIIQ